MGQEGTALEESPETFFARFQAHAVEVHLFPEPWGSPLLEVGVGGFILYAFDRGAPPAPTGRVRALLHGVAREVKPWEGEAFLELMGPAYRIGGKARPLGEGFYLLEEPIPLLLHSETPLPSRAQVHLWPPLMLFRE